jgi:hypothetical protein
MVEKTPGSNRKRWAVGAGTVDCVEMEQGLWRSWIPPSLASWGLHDDSGISLTWPVLMSREHDLMVEVFMPRVFLTCRVRRRTLDMPFLDSQEALQLHRQLHF